MNKQRAQEIAASPVRVNVTCNGIPVYIQNVDEAKGTARIFPLSQPEDEQEVTLDMLVEG